MRKVEDYSALSQAIMRHYGRDTVTNCFLDRGTLEREIGAETLYQIENDGGLFIFREREDFRIMNFYLSSCTAELIDFPADVVCEVPYRERDEKIKAVIRRLLEYGFNKRFVRVRLTKTTEAEEHRNGCISPVTEDETAASLNLIKRAFDSRTGCIPTEDEFLRDVRDGHVLAYRDGGIIGIVHYNEDAKTSDIRHVAVDERYRGQGIASSLVKAYSSHRAGRYRVWAREDYTAARRVYEKNGYTADGMRSAVLYFDKTGD